MSNIVEDFKINKIKNLTILFNRDISNLRNSYNNEIKRLYRARLNPTQRQLIINNINNKYQKIANDLKANYDNEIQKLNEIVPTEVNTVISTNSVEVITSVTKKALIFGLNYTGTSSQLNGCINDAKSIETYLKENGFTDIKMLTDETELKPTKSNILNEFKHLLENSKKGDILFIYYSGHGSYTLDNNGDELDGRDELLVPLDFNMIRDDELKSLITQYGKEGSNLYALFDCCHSGSTLDLKYQILEKLNYDDVTDNERNSETPCNTILISGCRDEQVSLETTINNKVQGLMTWSFLETTKNNKDISWRSLVKKMRELLRNKSYQIPQLSSGRLFNPDEKFLL